MEEDLFNITIHDDHAGEVLLHEQMTRVQAEQTLTHYQLVGDRAKTAFLRAILASDVYSLNGRSVLVRRVPLPIGD